MFTIEKIKRRASKFALFISLIFCLLSAIIPACAPAAEKLAPDLRFYAFDVGQGDSSLFVFPNGQTMLIDAGTKEGGRSVVRFLRDAAIKKIDVVVATHPHSDHIGGMPQLLNRVKVGEVWDSGYAHGSPEQIAFYQAVQDKKIPFGRPKRGYKRTFGDVSVEVLGPKMELRGTKSDANNNSIVLLVTYGKISFLMTGDMEHAERTTISPLPRATLLKAAHHGSSDAMDTKMIRQVNPFAIVLSYEKGNSYGHPHREVLDIFRKFPKIKRFDTVGGTLKFRTDGKQLTYPKNREILPDEKTH